MKSLSIIYYLYLGLAASVLAAEKPNEDETPTQLKTFTAAQIQELHEGVSGIINGSGSLTQTGTGTLTLSGTNTYTEPTEISAGLLTLGPVIPLSTDIVTETSNE